MTNNLWFLKEYKLSLEKFIYKNLKKKFFLKIIYKNLKKNYI